MAMAGENFLKKLFPDKLSLIFFVIALILNILIWLVIFWQIKPRSEPIFLHYNIYFGIDAIGDYWKLYYLPISGSVILLINTLISAFIYRREKIISHFLLITNIIAQIVLLVASLLIILLNI